MSLKDNFNQALKEILRNDKAAGEGASDDPKKKSGLDSFLKNKDTDDAPEEGVRMSGIPEGLPSYTESADFFRRSVNRSADPFSPPQGGLIFPEEKPPAPEEPLVLNMPDTEKKAAAEDTLSLGSLADDDDTGGAVRSERFDGPAADGADSFEDLNSDSPPPGMTASPPLPSDASPEITPEDSAGVSVDTASAIARSATGLSRGNAAESAPPPNSMAAAMNAAMSAAMGTAMGAGSGTSQGGFSPRPTTSFGSGRGYDHGGYGGGRGGSGGGMYPPPPPSPPPIRSASPFPSDPLFYESEETTVISRNIVVTGGTITGFANVHIDGSIKCDVSITKDVNVTGKVVGDISCNNAVMAGSSIQGSIASKGQVRMDRDSVLLGDISTQYLDINGRVKGNVAVGGKAEFKTDAVIVGDITASTITVLDGAVIKGYVNTTFLQDSETNIFPDAITVSDQ